MQSVDINLKMLFQKRVVRTKLDIQ